MPIRACPLALLLAALLSACGGASSTTTSATPDPARSRALVAEALTAVEAQDLDAARDKLRAAVEADPASAVAYHNLGVVETWRGDDAAARQAFEAALNKRPDFAEPALAIADLLIRSGDAESAVRFVEERLEAAPDSRPLREAGNRVRLQAGDTDAVVADAQQMFAEDEEDAAARKDLAAAFEAKGFPELALDVARSVAELESADAEVFELMARAHLALGQDHQARLALEEAIKRPGGAGAESYNSLGLLYFSARDYERAEPMFREAIRRWPGILSARVNLANTLLSQGRAAEAEAEFEALAQRAPGSPDVLCGQAAVYPAWPAADEGHVVRAEKAVGLLERCRGVVTGVAEAARVDALLDQARKRLAVERKRREMLERAPPPAAAP